MDDFKKEQKGISLKKGQLIRFLDVEDEEIKGKIFEVEEDNFLIPELNCWGSVRLVDFYPPLFTHKGKIEILQKTNKK